jgi:hypothetical protein
MKRIAILLAALLASSSVSAASKRLSDLVADEPTDAQTQAFLSGAGQAFLWANVELKVRKQQPLFCPPGDLVLNSHNYAQILGSYLDEDPDAAKASYIVAGSYVLKSLQKTFPCLGAN